VRDASVAQPLSAATAVAARTAPQVLDNFMDSPC
jgi:hypothetical protein